MLVGYARTSTLDQEAGLEAQLRELQNLGCKKVFHEQASSVAPRKALEQALEFTREGDTLVVTKLDRLARSTLHLCHIADDIALRGIALWVLDQNLDTSDATGRLLFHMLSAIAQFETELRADRQ